MSEEIPEQAIPSDDRHKIHWRRMGVSLWALVLAMACGTALMWALEPGPVPRVTATGKAYDDATLAKALAMGAGVRERRWEFIIIHHTATQQDNEASINRYHTEELRFGGTGYHFVIGNGSRSVDGCIEPSRRWRRQRPGAHCLVKNHPEYNDAGIGICLVGHFETDEPTPKQWETVLRLTAFLRKQYDIPLENVLGHGEVKNTACPGRNFNFARFIDALRKRALRGRRAGR